MLVISRNLDLKMDIAECLSKEKINNILSDGKNNILCIYNIPYDFKFPFWLMIPKKIHYCRKKEGGVCIIMNKETKNVLMERPDYLKNKAIIGLNMQCKIFIQVLNERNSLKYNDLRWAQKLGKYVDSLALEYKKEIVVLCNDKNRFVYKTRYNNLMRKKVSYGYLYYSRDLDKYIEYDDDDLVFDLKKRCNIKILKKKKREGDILAGNESKILKSRETEDSGGDESESKYTVYRNDEQSQHVEFELEGKEDEEGDGGEENDKEEGGAGEDEETV